MESDFNSQKFEVTRAELSKIMELLSHSGHIIKEEGYAEGYCTEIAAQCLAKSKELQEKLR